MRVGVLLASCVMVLAGALPAFADPVPPRDCNGEHSGPPHSQANYDGQADKECHGVSPDGGQCTKTAGLYHNAEVDCTMTTSGVSRCLAHLNCPGQSKKTCGGRGFSSFGGVNASGKAYIWCYDDLNGGTPEEYTCP